MTITPDQFKEIMRLFDAGDFESRKEAVSILYEGLWDIITHYENENKKPDPEPESEPESEIESELEEDPKITEVTSEIQNNESDNVMEEIN